MNLDAPSMAQWTLNSSIPYYKAYHIHLCVFDAVSARRVAWVYAGEVGRLDATRPKIAVVQYAVTICADDAFPSPGPECRIPVPQPRLAPP